MNRRGQIDKIISALPVMILIFLLMAVFVLLSSAIKVWKDPNRVEIFSFSGGKFLSEIVQVNEKEYTIIDGLAKSGNTLVPSKQSEEERIFYSKFSKELINLAGKECMILKSPTNFFYIHEGIFESTGNEVILKHYRDNGKISRILLNVGKRPYQVEYYHGGCLNE
ncbi:MAG: hypothetical protein AABW65_00790 [Nanoarchaeota archaeon]